MWPLPRRSRDRATLLVEQLALRAQAYGPDVVPPLDGCSPITMAWRPPAKNLEGLTLAAIGLVCSVGFALEPSGAIGLGRYPPDLIQRWLKQHLEAVGVVVAVDVPGDGGPWL